MRLKDKVALITGGGSGLGRATSLLFAQEGAKVAVADINAVGGAQTAADIGEMGGDAVFVEANVATAAGAEAAVRGAVERFGALHILFNNAGIAGTRTMASIEEVTEEDWDRVLGVNLKGVFLCAKYAVPEMKKAGGGAIVNTASIAGIIGLHAHAYGASKGGVVILTKTMALELAKKGIRVNAVAPGFIDTPLTRGSYRGLDDQQHAANVARLADEAPMGRIGQPEDIAQAVLYLASDDASFVTGHTLVVDGGFTAQ